MAETYVITDGSGKRWEAPIVVPEGASPETIRALGQEALDTGKATPVATMGGVEKVIREAAPSVIGGLAGAPFGPFGLVGGAMIGQGVQEFADPFGARNPTTNPYGSGKMDIFNPGIPSGAEEPNPWNIGGAGIAASLGPAYRGVRAVTSPKSAQALLTRTVGERGETFIEAMLPDAQKASALFQDVRALGQHVRVPVSHTREAVETLGAEMDLVRFPGARPTKSTVKAAQ